MRSPGRRAPPISPARPRGRAPSPIWSRRSRAPRRPGRRSSRRGLWSPISAARRGFRVGRAETGGTPAASKSEKRSPTDGSAHELPLCCCPLSAVLLARLSCRGALSPVNKTLLGGVAIDGYDPVAYFTDGRPVEGSKEFDDDWNGATWRFASAAHRDLFAAAPEKYAPQYGGYCAWAVVAGLHRRHRSGGLDDRRRPALPQLQPRGADEVGGGRPGQHRQGRRATGRSCWRGVMEAPASWRRSAATVGTDRRRAAADEQRAAAALRAGDDARLRAAGERARRTHARRRAALAAQRRRGPRRGAGGLRAGLPRPAAVRGAAPLSDLAAPHRGQRRADEAAQPRARPEESIEPLLPTLPRGRSRGRRRYRDWPESADELLERAEVRALVRAAIDRLPETYRTVLAAARHRGARHRRGRRAARHHRRTP